MLRHSAEEYRKWTSCYTRKRREEKNEKQVTLWVPESRISELKQYAEMLRDEEDYKAGRLKEQPQKIEIPKIETPDLEHQYSYLRIDKDEIALRMIVKANGGDWISGGSNPEMHRTWRMRNSVAVKLGLKDRIVATRKRDIND